MIKKSLFLLILVALVMGGAFAQRVGDTVQVNGEPWTVRTISGNTMTLEKVVAQGDGPVNWVAVADSTFGSAPNDSSRVNGVAFGNNTWVAVGGAGKIAYSSDGRSWTAIPPGTGAGQSTFGTTNIIDVAFANNLFFAVGRDRMATSPDGRTWTAVATPPTGTWNSIAFGGGRWVVVGNAGRTAYSTDGRTWTAVDASGAIANNNIVAVAFGNNRFVIAGNSGGALAYSSNGAAWTAVPTANVGGLLYNSSVAYFNNRWVAGARNRIAYSSDGASWTGVAMPNTSNAVQSNINGIAFGNNRWVNVGGRGLIYYSTDATSWTAVANTTFTNEIFAVAYGNGRFVAVGSLGRMAYCDW